MNAEGASAYNILWDSSPDKLCHSFMVFGRTSQNVGAPVNGQSYAVRPDAFNESDVTHSKDCVMI